MALYRFTLTTSYTDNASYRSKFTDRLRLHLPFFQNQNLCLSPSALTKSSFSTVLLKVTQAYLRLGPSPRVTSGVTSLCNSIPVTVSTTVPSRTSLRHHGCGHSYIGQIHRRYIRPGSSPYRYSPDPQPGRFHRLVRNGHPSRPLHQC